MAGSPSKRTPERQEVILRAIRVGMTMRTAAGLADMNVATLNRWARTSAPFRATLARAHAEVEARATAVVMDDAFGRPAQYDDMNRLIRVEVKANPDMAWRWLQTRRREEWGQHINIDVRGIARSVAAEMGLDVEEVLAQAEALLAENH